MTKIDVAPDTDLPPPLVPPDVDLRDFAFMPLDVVRVRDSDLAAEETPESCWAALLLWCASWHQVPAGSIPDSDQWQAKQAGYVARGRIDKTWESVRDGALRNWIKCSDGRLYHPVVAEKALESWQAKLAQRARTKAATEAREARRRAQQTASEAARDDQRDGQRDVARDDQRDVVRDVHQGTGTVKGQGIEEKNPSGSRRLATTGDQTPTIPCPYGSIVDAYHAELPDLSKVRLRDGPTWTARQKAMRSMWGWVLSSRKSDGTPRAQNAEQALAWITGYFRRARDNDFVMGRRAPGAGHENWRADFDYLVSPRGMKQVIEKTQEAA